MASLPRTQVSPRRLDWLSEELAAWQREGLVAEEQARTIRDRYEANTRTALASLVVVLGVLFLGIGVLWLVATNYEHLSPLVRFALVAFLWLGCTVAGALFERRGAPLRLLGALLFGGVIFQAAQSLNVPAYEPTLLLAWSAGALASAYALRAHGPVVVGVTAGLGWYLWTLGRESESAAAVTLGLALATPVIAAVAVAHRRDPMGGPWLRAAAVTALAAPFFVTFTGSADDADLWQRPFYAGLAVALIALVAAATRAGKRDLGLLAGAAGVAAAVVAVVAVTPEDPLTFFGASARPGALAHALVTSAVFLACAVAVAVAGVVREAPGLVNMAAAALVLFVTLQSFGVFAPLVSGGALFLVVGTLLVGTGLLVDRGRRRLQEEIEA